MYNLVGIFVFIILSAANLSAQEVAPSTTDAADTTPSVTFVLKEALEMSRSSLDKQPKAEFHFTGNNCRRIFSGNGGHNLRCTCEVYFTTPVPNQNLTISAHTQWKLTGIVPAIGTDSDSDGNEGLELVQSTNSNNKMVLQCYSRADQGTYHNLVWQPSVRAYQAWPTEILDLDQLSKDKTRVSSQRIFDIQKQNTPSSWNYFRSENRDFYIPGVIN